MMGELSNWNGRVYKISRAAMADFSLRQDAQHTGVYFLFGKDRDMCDTVYIGEAEKMFHRLKQHINDHEEWDECIAVISKDNNLNKAHVKRLEYAFYHLAQTANRFVLMNASVPVNSSVSEYDQAMLVEFIDQTRLLVNGLGYKVFDAVERPPLPVEQNMLFRTQTTRGASAVGMPVTDGFVVFKDSVISPTITDSYPIFLQKLRERLLAGGVIDERLTFTRDYVFSSPSAAASIIMGRSANGRIEWKNRQGQTINDIETVSLSSLV